MRFSPIKASVLVLALFAAPVATLAPAMAAGDGTMVLAQAEAGSKRIDNIKKFLARSGNLAKLDDAKLQQRLERARAFQNTPNLPPDLLTGLQQAEQEMSQELANRHQAGTSGNEDTAQTQNKHKKDQQAQQDQQQNADTGQVSGDIDAFLASVSPASGLDDKALRQQLRKAAELAKSDSISGNQRKKLRQVVREARDELAKRKQGNADQQSSDNGKTQDMGGNDQATAGDNADVSKLSDAELRKRLATMRDRLASDQLSPDEKKALRKQLASEKQILRSRVGQENTTKVNGDGNTVINTNINTTINRDVVKVVVRDTRPGRDLNDVELRRRINVFQFAVGDSSFSDNDKVRWRAVLQSDRQTLRQRLLAARDRRRNELRVGLNNGDLKIKLGLNFQPDRPPPPRYVFAAEADDADLEDVLTAPPRRKISRRYTLDEVENSPDLRDAVARIEIDTVKFGFGEGFLREEEVDNLDHIGGIMEKILAAYPEEQFVIEGHTDAVGPAEANLELSRQRAEAVKEALVTYYVIPPENLKTVGFGEKYLKIPTEEPEAENRRVSVARITALVGALNE